MPSVKWFLNSNITKLYWMILDLFFIFTLRLSDSLILKNYMNMRSLHPLHFGLFFLILPHNSYLQNYKIDWGNEANVGKNVLSLNMVEADNTGYFFVESRGAFGSYQPSYQLRKFDQSNNEVFFMNYRTNLKGLIFHAIKPLKEKLFLFASDFDKKAGLFKIYGVEIDKTSGNLLGDFIELANIPMESKDVENFIFKPSQDSSLWQLIIDEIPKGKEGRVIHIYKFNNKLSKTNNGIIKLNDDPKMFSLEDLVILKQDGGYFLLAKEFENITPEKMKPTLMLKRYILRRYDIKGRKLDEFPLENGTDKFSLGGRLFTQPSGKIIFAGFYSNSSNKKTKALNGVFTAAIDEKNNKLGIISSIELNREMLNGNENYSLVNTVEKDKEGKNDKGKTKDEEINEGISEDFVIRSLFEGSEPNSLVLLAESYELIRYSTQNRTLNGSADVDNYIFKNRELMIIDATNEGKLKSINLIPKYQYERMDGPVNMVISSMGPRYLGFFGDESTSSFYSSISATKWENNLYIFYNDHPANSSLLVAPSKEYKVVTDFNKSVLFGIKFNMATGKMDKTQIYTNNNDLIAMPRFGIVVGNQIYFPASKARAFASTKLHVGILTIK